MLTVISVFKNVVIFQYFPQFQYFKTFACVLGLLLMSFSHGYLAVQCCLITASHLVLLENTFLYSY